MSAIIRRRLKGTCKRATGQLQQALTFSPDPSPSATTDRKKLDDLKDRLANLKAYTEAMGTSLNVMYECHRDWEQYQEKLTTTQRAEELKVQTEFLDEENCDYLTLLDRTQEVVDGLRMQEAAIMKVIRTLERKLEDAAKRESASGGPSATAGGPVPHVVPQVNLPLLDLPRYGGDVLKFSEFWDLFEATVDKDPNLSDRQKFSYLRISLHGKAEKLLEGLSVTDANYAVAKELLQNTYGKKDYIVQALYRELDELGRPHANAVSLREFMQELEKTCRQLEKLGEDLDQKQILVKLESKMPIVVLSEVVKTKQTASTWSTKEFRETLKRVVELHETIESMSGLEFGGSTQTPPSQRRRQVYRADNEDETEVRPSAMFATRRSTGRGPVCVLCEESHYASDCRRYGTVEERFKRLSQLKRCFRCGGMGHEGRNCRSTRPCYFCRSDKHHSCLCRTPRGEEAVLSHKEKPAKVMTVSCDQPSEKANEDRPERIESPDPYFNLVPEGQWIRTSTVLVAPKEPQVNTLLLTARAKVMNPSDYSHRSVPTILLDNGSQRSFISTELALSLRLIEMGREEIAVTTMTTAEPLITSCPVYEFIMNLENGRQCRITAYGMDKLIGVCPVMQVEKCAGPENDNCYWKVSKQLAEPQVILGADYYWQMRVREEAYLPEGMIVLQSELGYLAAGKVTNEEKLLERVVEGQKIEPHNCVPLPAKQLNEECQTESEPQAIQAEPQIAHQHTTELVKYDYQQSVAVAMGLALLLLAAALPMANGAEGYYNSGTNSWLAASLILLVLVALVVLCCCYAMQFLKKRTAVSADAMPLLAFDRRREELWVTVTETGRQVRFGIANEGPSTAADAKPSMKPKRDQGVQAGRGVWTEHTSAKRRHSVPMACVKDTVRTVGPTVSYGHIRRIKSLANIRDGLLRHTCDAVYGPKNGPKVGDAHVREAGLNSNPLCEPFWPRVSRKAI